MFHILICVAVILTAAEVNSIPFSFNSTAQIIGPGMDPSNFTSTVLTAAEVSSIPFSFNSSAQIIAPRLDPSNFTSTVASAQIITSRLNPSNSFLTSFNYDVSSCSCSGSDTLRSNGIWTSWDDKRGSRPDNAVYCGGLYVMRVQYNNNGLIVGKYSPDVRAAWIPHGGYEHGGFASFEILRHTNYVWEGNKNNQNLWIPGGKTASGSVIYICSVFHIVTPSQFYPVANDIPGKYDGGRCYISYGGLEYGYDQVGFGTGQYQILKRVN